MNIHALKRTISQRLRGRQLQAATYGISADPVISIEAEVLSKLKTSLERAIEMHEAGWDPADDEQAARNIANQLGIVVDKFDYTREP